SAFTPSNRSFRGPASKGSSSDTEHANPTILRKPLCDSRTFLPPSIDDADDIPAIVLRNRVLVRYRRHDIGDAALQPLAPHGLGRAHVHEPGQRVQRDPAAAVVPHSRD